MNTEPRKNNSKPQKLTMKVKLKLSEAKKTPSAVC